MLQEGYLPHLPRPEILVASEGTLQGLFFTDFRVGNTGQGPLRAWYVGLIRICWGVCDPGKGAQKREPWAERSAQAGAELLFISLVCRIE
jgi:hypothetical protein